MENSSKKAEEALAQGEGLPPSYGQAYTAPPGYDAQSYPQQGYPQQVPNQAFYPQQQQGNVPPVGYAPVTQQVVFTPVQPLENPPPDYMAYAIFTTLCCCWPIGIFAIIRSLATRDASNRGDQVTANANSAKTKRLANWSTGVGCIFMVLSIAIIVFVYVWMIPNLREMYRH
ncbi:unnamed protein product [Owenia fusiformis]|uniref:Uncharacterized protein n=1 Tax=Owenia fusiformis TaxID=6347 RepID=A0A8S4NVF0_OWEFU|nr:unnamed protein product [Owenia fusiformis]